MKQLCILFVFVTFGLSQDNSLSAPKVRDNSFAFFGGMGVHVVSAPDIVEYINTVTIFSQRVDDFGTAVDFFGGVEFPIANDWGVKLEHAYLFKSYSVPGKLGGIYDLYYSTQSPTITIQKIISGKGFFFKIGAGGGYHFGYASQKVSTFGIVTEYVSSGIGVKADVVGQTAFDDNFFGYIGGSLGWEFLGELKDSKGLNLFAPNSTSPVSLRYFHAGIRFGIIQYL